MANATITVPVKHPPHPAWFISLLSIGSIVKGVSVYLNVFTFHKIIGGILSPIAVPLNLGGTVILCIFLFRLWQLAQKSSMQIKKPTHGEAIGFAFIPFFNLYWLFILWRNLAIHLNSLTNNRIGLSP
jgi:hypothetical protein